MATAQELLEEYKAKMDGIKGKNFPESDTESFIIELSAKQLAIDSAIKKADKLISSYTNEMAKAKNKKSKEELQNSIDIVSTTSLKPLNELKSLIAIYLGQLKKYNQKAEESFKALRKSLSRVNAIINMPMTNQLKADLESINKRIMNILQGVTPPDKEYNDPMYIEQEVERSISNYKNEQTSKTTQDKIVKEQSAEQGKLRDDLVKLSVELSKMRATSPGDSDVATLLSSIDSYMKSPSGGKFKTDVVNDFKIKYAGLEGVKKEEQKRYDEKSFEALPPQKQLELLLDQKVPKGLQGKFSVASIISDMNFGNNQWFKEYLQNLAEVKSPSYAQISGLIEVFRNREQAFSKVDNTEGIPESTKTAIKKELIANPNSDADVAIAKFTKGYEEATRTGRQKQVEDAATARAESVDKRDILKKELLKGGLSKADEKSKREELATAEEEINKYTTEVLGEGELQRLKGRTEELQKRLDGAEQSLRQLEASEPTTNIQHIESGEKRPLTLQANRRLTAWNKAVALKKKEIAQLELAIKQSEKSTEKERGIVSGKTAAEESMDKEAQDMIKQKQIDDKKKEARTQIEAMNNLDEEKKNIFINEIINIPSGFSEEKVDEAISDTLNEANKQSIDKSGMIEVMPGVWEKKTPEQIKAEQVKEEPKTAPVQEQPKPQVANVNITELTTAQNAETRLDALAPTIAITQNRLAALPFSGNTQQLAKAVDDANVAIKESPADTNRYVAWNKYNEALDSALELSKTLDVSIAERDSLRKIVSDFIAKYGRTPLHMTAEEFQSIISGGANQQ